jgi:alpha-methylacyl-CoA racemase
VPPMNLLGDFAGGGLHLALGLLAALIEANRSGKGQVVDASMLDGALSLMSWHAGMRAQGRWIDRRASNVSDGGAPWYGTYATADHRYVAVGAIEEPFWEAMLTGLNIAPAALPPRQERSNWSNIRAALEAAFAQRTRDEWEAVFARTDACVTPVLEPSEVGAHPHIRIRSGIVDLEGVHQPAPAPRFSRTPAEARPAVADPNTLARVLIDWRLEPPCS